MVSYHVDLMFEAGLINGEPVTSSTSTIYDVISFRLTWDGHEFLDNVKDNSRWNKIKKYVKEKGGSFSLNW